MHVTTRVSVSLREKLTAEGGAVEFRREELISVIRTEVEAVGDIMAASGTVSLRVLLRHVVDDGVHEHPVVITGMQSTSGHKKLQ